MFARVESDTITDGPRPIHPEAAQRLDDGTWRKLAGDVPEQHRCGWYEIADTARPADTATVRHEWTVEVVDGWPTVVWVPVDKTQEEQDADQANAEAVERDDALRNSIAWLDARSAEADAHTVTAGNHQGTTQAIIDNLALFYGGFANLLRNRYRQ